MAAKCFYYEKCGNELVEYDNIFLEYNKIAPGVGVAICGKCMQRVNPQEYEKQKKEMQLERQ